MPFFVGTLMRFLQRGTTSPLKTCLEHCFKKVIWKQLMTVYKYLVWKNLWKIQKLSSDNKRSQMWSIPTRSGAFVCPTHDEFVHAALNGQKKKKHYGLIRCVSHTPLHIGRMWFPRQKGECKRDEPRLGITAQGDEEYEVVSSGKEKSCVLRVGYIFPLPAVWQPIDIISTWFIVADWLVNGNPFNKQLDFFWIRLSMTNKNGQNYQVGPQKTDF